MSWNYPREDYTGELYTLFKPSRKPSVLSELVHWTWSSIHAACAYLVDDAYIQIILNMDLAGQAHVRRQFGFNRESIALEFSHFAGFAVENLDAASGATGIAAAAVKNIDTSIFERQHELLPGRRVGFNETGRSFSLDLWHLLCLSWSFLCFFVVKKRETGLLPSPVENV